jgi:hypothetical protein
VRLFVAVLVWIAAAAGAGGLASVVAGSIHVSPSSAATGGTGSSGSVGGGSAPAAPFDASSVTATDPDSLFTAANFAKALATARTRMGADARVSNVALYPGYLDMTQDKNGVEVNVYVDAQGNSTITNTSASIQGDSAFPLAKIPADAPATLAQRIATLAHVPESQLHYMVVDMNPPPPGVEWLVYTTAGNKVAYFISAGPTGRMIEYLSNNTGPFTVR